MIKLSNNITDAHKSREIFNLLKNYFKLDGKYLRYNRKEDAHVITFNDSYGDNLEFKLFGSGSLFIKRTFVNPIKGYIWEEIKVSKLLNNNIFIDEIHLMVIRRELTGCIGDIDSKDIKCK